MLPENNNIIKTLGMPPVSNYIIPQSILVSILEFFLDGHWSDEEPFIFLQITDLHISKYKFLDIKDDLQEFFTTTLDTIKPTVVLASGDLTDAKDSDGVGSGQILEEWQTYQNLLRKNNVLRKTIYLDIRGNHDSFDLMSLNDPENYYLTHSGYKNQQKSSFLKTVSKGNITISFLAVDATMNPGPKKLFNFLGHLTEDKLVELSSLRRAAMETSDAVIYFGHFPSSCIVSEIPAMEMMRGGLVYLSGHLHTLAGLAPQLYTLHHTGTPELELGDWKENRRYRLMAVDNGMLSFVDVDHGKWPVVLVTNPKNSEFISPQVEKIENILQSSSIRVLAFSPVGIKSVSVKVNNEDWKTCKLTSENLYTVEWSPDDYESRVNTLRVEVVDGFGDSQEISQSFVVRQEDVGELKYKLYARIILMSSPHSLLMCLWAAGFMLCCAPVVLARLSPAFLEQMTSSGVRRRLALLMRHKTVYHIYLFTTILVTFCPWHVGEVLSGHVGFVFPWATIVRGTVLPSFYNYVFSLFHLWFFHQPLLWALTFKMSWRVDETRDSKITLALTNIPVTIVLSLQAILLIVLYYFPSNLGIFREIAIMLAPMEIVTIVIGFILNGIVSFHIRQAQLNR